jgi:hypothetical protein
MGIDHSDGSVAISSRPPTLLFVTDLINGKQNIHEIACTIVGRYGAQLELMHVIDPRCSRSKPDGEMGAQFDLEMLASRMRAMRICTKYLLSFGYPEELIPKRAAEIKAKLLILQSSGPLTEPAKHNQDKLLDRLLLECDCPVLTISQDMRNRNHADSLRIYGSLSQVSYAVNRNNQSITVPLNLKIWTL